MEGKAQTASRVSDWLVVCQWINVVPCPRHRTVLIRRHPERLRAVAASVAASAPFSRQIPVQQSATRRLGRRTPRRLLSHLRPVHTKDSMQLVRQLRVRDTDGQFLALHAIQHSVPYCMSHFCCEHDVCLSVCLSVASRSQRVSLIVIPFCLSGWMSVGHSATYSLPRLIDHNQIWSAGIYLSLDSCKPFWIP